MIDDNKDFILVLIKVTQIISSFWYKKMAVYLCQVSTIVLFYYTLERQK